MKKQKVIYAKLHASFFLPGIGDLKNTLPPDNKTIQGFEMWRNDQGNLMLSANKGGRLAVAEIPSANVVGMLYGELHDIPDQVVAPQPPPPAEKALPPKAVDKLPAPKKVVEPKAS